LVVTRPQRAVKFIRRKKYLVTWSLALGHEELEKISRRPEALEKGLNYVTHMTKDNKLELYRIVPMAELTHFGREIHGESRLAHPSGIAIAEANSIEEVRKMLDQWVKGFSYGGVSVQNYLEFDIKPLVEIGRRGREE